jgi:serine/threonine protein kinase
MARIINIFKPIYEYLFGYKNKVTIYTKSGDFKKRNNNTYNLDFFRKEVMATRERKIAEILKNNSHINVVNIYNVNDKYIDMELVNVDEDYDKPKLQIDMKKAKEHLQSLGIIYLDWKPDNTGLGLDGNYKLFDFDACGIIDVNTKEWIIKPVWAYWSYRMAEKAGLTDPFEMDNYTFDIGLMDKPYSDNDL